jgi:hypothetical protein
VNCNPWIDAFLEMSDPEKNRELPRDLSLVALVTSPDLGQLTNASKPQRLLMLAADGKPANDILPPDRMLFHIGAERLPSGRPRLVVLRTGVRAGKSLIAALALLHSALTCEFRREPNLEAGEIPGHDGLIGIMKGEFVRALIVAPKLKMSRAPLNWIKSRMEHSPILKKHIVKVKEESIVIRRPDGAEVTIEIVAADSGGGNLRSTWLAGILFDEAAFHDGEDGVVNLAENYRAAAPRLLHGAQAWIVSSPWSDDDHFNKLFTMYFGKPGLQFAFHSDTRSMNPGVEQSVIDEERARDPDNAAREYDAVPLSSSNTAFFPPDAIEKSVNYERQIYLPPIQGVEHKAGTDLAFRKNSSALAISRAAKLPSQGREILKAQLAYHEEKRPPKGASLRPSEVIIDFAKTCRSYRARKMCGDHWSRDTADEELAKLRAADRTFDIVYEPMSQQIDDIGARFDQVRRLMQEGQAELPNEPVLLRQFRDTKARALPGGKIGIQLPKHGSTHGDVLVAAVNSLVQVDLAVRTDEKKSMTRGRREMNNTGGF